MPRRARFWFAIAAIVVAILTRTPRESRSGRTVRAPERTSRRTTPGYGDDDSVPTRRRRTGSAVAPMVALAVGLLLVLGVAPLGLLVVARPERPAGIAVEVSNGTDVPPGASGLRDVPVGLPDGADIRTVDDVAPYAIRALGPERANALLALLGSGRSLAGQLGENSLGEPSYPYRYIAVETVLGGAPMRGSAPTWTALGAALTVLAAQTPLASGPTTPEVNAGPAAYAVLRGAAADGGCPAQLNLLLLLAGDASTGSTVLAGEQRRAEEVCPGDVTPGWLVGQAQLRLFTEGVYPEEPEMPTAEGLATMQRLVDRHPTDIAALTGLGDAYLAAAASLNGSPPFTARRYYRQAVEAYDRAVDHGGRYGAAAGLGRALVGLGDPARAIELLAPIAATSATPGPILEVLIAAQEASSRFGDGERSARQLADLGPAAYPRARAALLPAPQRSWDSTLQDVTFAFSLGADRLQPLRSRLLPEGGAGAYAEDLSFIPTFRDQPGLTGTQAACAGWAWRRNAVLAGHVATALGYWSTSIAGARVDGSGCDAYDADPSRLRNVAELLVAGDGALADEGRQTAADDWQNLLRWSGDLPAARQFAVRWDQARGERSDLPVQRLGEIDFLLHRHDDAAAEFAVAARRARLLRYEDDLAVAKAELNRSVSLIAAGRSAEAEPTLRRLVSMGLAGYAYQASAAGGGGTQGFAVLTYHASSQLADEERRTGRLRAAVEDYDTALSWLARTTQPELRPEVLRNNAALAHLGLQNSTQASELIDQALREDPHNPVTLMTAGFISDRRGDISGAARFDERALQNDPGLFPAANDLGVELARLDQPSEAREALWQAVGARPDYALGWFNLGVLESSSGPARVLAAQHALGTAYRLDPDLRARQLELTIDGQVYRTGLDLSKPVPPAWTFADLSRPTPAAAVGLLAIVGAGLGLARTSHRGATQNAEKWLEPTIRRLDGLAWAPRVRAPVWAVAVSVLTFLLAALHRGPVGTTLLYPIGLLALVVATMSARVLVGRRAGRTPRQRSWGPGLVFGLLGGAVGYPFAPLPVLEGGGADHDRGDGNPQPHKQSGNDGLPEAATPARLHLAAPLTLGGAALLLFLESAWTRMPLIEAWAAAALIMCASLLVPVGPLDGKQLGRAGIAMSAGVIGTAVLFALGLL